MGLEQLDNGFKYMDVTSIAARGEKMLAYYLCVADVVFSVVNTIIVEGPRVAAHAFRAVLDRCQLPLQMMFL